MRDTSAMSIPALVRLQSDRRLEQVHLVHFGLRSFTIAHTDDERAARDEHPLEECALHRWLTTFRQPPAKLGVYVASPAGDEWKLDPLESWSA